MGLLARLHLGRSSTIVAGGGTAEPPGPRDLAPAGGERLTLPASNRSSFASTSRKADDAWYKSLNTNALTSTRRYEQPNARVLSQYVKALSLDPSRLNPGDVTLDSGGGFGAAHLELVKTRGTRSIVINTQDNLAALQTMFRELERKGDRAVHFTPNYTDSFDGVTVASVAGVPAGSISGVARALGLDTTALDATTRKKQGRAAEVRALVQDLETALTDVLKTGRFQFVPSYVEDELGKYRGQVKLITDSWGAFSYSPARVTLLEGFYDALREDGEARIYVSRKVLSHVHLPGGESRDLVEYLTKQYPTIFSAEVRTYDDADGDDDVLVMKRDPKVESLKLGLELDGKIRHPAKKGDFDPPEVSWAPGPRAASDR